MIEAPQFADFPETALAVIPLTIPRARIREVMGPGIGELMGAVAAQCIGPAGPWFTHHHRIDPDVFEFEICVPVSGPVRPDGRVRAGRLRKTRVARTVYRGGYEGLGAAWGEFKAWSAAQGLDEAGDLWEVYAVGPESGLPPDQWQTQLNLPLRSG
jgi:effector-binding domain-containing protein